MSGRYYVVYITASSAKEAEKIGAGLLTERLAACVQVSSPILSMYFWEGEFCKQTEHQIVAKTTKDLYPLLEAYVKENHSYELPQIVSVDIERGLPGYLEWIDESLKKDTI
ncbi:MAG: divalent-cation tolerance protein CutA [Nitrospinota bacterium]